MAECDARRYPSEVSIGGSTTESDSDDAVMHDLPEVTQSSQSEESQHTEDNLPKTADYVTTEVLAGFKAETLNELKADLAEMEGVIIPDIDEKINALLKQRLDDEIIARLPAKPEVENKDELARVREEMARMRVQIDALHSLIALQRGAMVVEDTRPASTAGLTDHRSSEAPS
jgi:hypothetical protein